MCLSPDEMTVEQLQDRVDRIRAMLADESLGASTSYYEARLESYEKLLKEKADAGQMA